MSHNGVSQPVNTTVIATPVRAKPSFGKILLRGVMVGLVLVVGLGLIVGIWYLTTEQSAANKLGTTRATTASVPPRSTMAYSILRYLVMYFLQSGNATTSLSEPAARVADDVSTLAAAPPVRPRYSVRAGSFRAKAEAEALHRLLARKGYPSSIKTIAVSGKGIRFRVQVGSYMALTPVEMMAERLRVHEHLAVLIMPESP